MPVFFIKCDFYVVHTYPNRYPEHFQNNLSLNESTASYLNNK